MKTLLPLSGSILCLAAACAPTVPAELADARHAYEQATRGAAATYAPAELHKAEQALGRAERSFADAPHAPRTRDLAYYAARKAEEADATGNTELARRDLWKAQNAYQQLQTRRFSAIEHQLGRTQSELGRTQAELGREQAARGEAERRALEAEQQTKEVRSALAKLAKVKSEPRGVVITLSGSVLFASGESVLLPAARERLDQVAQALASSKEQRIVVEGYTDSRGSDAVNTELSRRRAEAVRAYLISRGYDADKIEAVGFGMSKPVSTNETAEGRANNRRVEIVIQPKKEAE